MMITIMNEEYKSDIFNLMIEQQKRLNCATFHNDQLDAMAMQMNVFIVEKECIFINWKYKKFFLMLLL